MASSNPPPFDDEGEVREGFLCPLCKKDLQSFHQLQSHYEEEHSSEDLDVKGQLKSFVRKAKNKFLKREGEERTDSGSQERYEAYSYGGVDPYMWDPQEIGATKSHLADFKKHRAARIDHYVVEVNKLIIRLEKLASFDRTNADSAKIRAIEKSVVPWVSDHDVPFCPDCGNKFSIRNRRHHCRLCGSIMCKKCMEVVSLPLANKLTNASKQVLAAHSSPNLSPNNSAHTSRRGSISSLSSVSSILDEKDDDRIRCCGHCQSTLLKREQQIDEREFTPDIVKFYQKLRLCMEKVDIKAPEYIRMAQSINAGETTYNLEHANDLRVEVQKLYELIDALSKKILTLGMNEEPKPHPKALQLQKMIRYSATLFVQEKLLGLMSLPTKEKYEELKEIRKKENERKLLLERKAALEAQRRTEERGKDFVPRSAGAPNGEVPTLQKNRARKTEGWLPTFSTPRDTGISDPLLQQIHNITSFIEQAKKANRGDEVQMLQENLRQLQDEYDQQQVEMAIELSRRMAEEEAMQREQLEVLREKEWEREQNKCMSQHIQIHSLDFREPRPLQYDGSKEKSNQINHTLGLDTGSMEGIQHFTPSPLVPVLKQPNGETLVLGSTSTENSLPNENKNALSNPFSEAGLSTPIDPSNPFADDLALEASKPQTSSRILHRTKKEYNPFEDEDDIDLPAGQVANCAPNPFEEVGNPFCEQLELSSNPFEVSTSRNPFEEDHDAGGEDVIEEDLLLQQIDNIKAYIFDAKHSGRLDEVELLTENLKDLRRKLVAQKGGYQ
ncbi:rabenosyn-5 [Ambystoma mexicanum]|uniref:rabenosyn-5 n=1 Tax=Ambystoma mexicanum TaxID=8296 RepID=UPI0037E7B21F